jgi:hypothetical protein
LSLAQQTYHGRISRTTFEETLSILGSMGKRAVLAELESKKVYSPDTMFLEIGPIMQCLVPFFGASAAQLLMNQALKKNKTHVHAFV